MARSNLFAVWRAREAELGRRITYREVRQATGVSATTLAAWAAGRAGRFHRRTVDALCRYFQCAAEDLIVPDGAAPG